VSDLGPMITSARQFRRFAIALSVVGVVVQLLLSVYYLEVGHAPRPRNVAIGLIGSAAQRAPIEAAIAKQGGFEVTTYASLDELKAAVGDRASFGGLDVSGPVPHLYVATAAGPTAATYMKSAFTAAMQQQVSEQLAAITAAGKPVPPATVVALSTPPEVTDLAPLPDTDKYGSALSFLVQALALGGTIASAGLGRLIPRTRRSLKRGLGHLTTLIAYAAGSAAAVSISMRLFDIGTGADHVTLFGVFFLVSLAVIASTAALVALIGQAGMGAGLIYFGVGTVISGASIPSEFLPPVARAIGQALPTGAGAHAVRDTLYFPDAAIAGPIWVLLAYSLIGCVVLLVTNLRANDSDRTEVSELATL
jgi:hypothetical protein